MKKETATEFYTKICIWTCLCLILAAAFHQIKAVVINSLKSENESSAAQSLQTIKTLQAQYALKHQGKFAPNFDELIKSVNLDERFGGQNPVVNGYVFSMKIVEMPQTKPDHYSINADPLSTPSADDSELRHFYFDSTLGTTKSTEENRPATADDPAI